MKKVIYIINLLVITISLSAQDTDRRQSIYIEGMGMSISKTINYEWNLDKSSNAGFALRVGMGVFQSEKNLNPLGINEDGFVEQELVSIPVGVNYLIGKKRSFLELSAGVTALYEYAGVTIDREVMAEDSTLFLVPSAMVGYRFLPIHNGITFRINGGTVLYEGEVYPMVGTAIGYSF